MVSKICKICVQRVLYCFVWFICMCTHLILISTLSHFMIFFSGIQCVVELRVLPELSHCVCNYIYLATLQISFFKVLLSPISRCL
jgi:hypothetical protein